MIGKTISHYQILEKLGEGGMGEVYRAEDTKLGRPVAIKVLPDVFARDPERLARFEREAKLLASLNHPNIAAIYGLEEADGKRFLVLELVEGQTLAERLRKGPLPVEDTLDVCRQIAEGLEAAHEKGIIHRDLKPANIKITPEGKVKILDFGLAKAFHEEPAAADLSQSPTVTEQMSRPGVILGTAAYMSPEQARGKPVDKRTDIWAFGCILCECLTGKRAFEGDTVTETLASILRGEPDWQALPAATSWKVKDLLHRCLQKDPKDRLHDIADARLEIDEAMSGTGVGSPAAEAVPGPTPTRLRAWRLAHGALTTVSLLALAGVGAALWTGRWSTSPAATQVTRLTIALPAGQAVTSAPAISRDGRTVAFTAGRASGSPQLYIRGLDEFESHAVPGTEGAAMPFFSPDGRSIAFFARGRLHRWNLGGGAPQTLADAPTPLGGTWGEDGTIVFVPVLNGGLHQVSASGGTPEVLIRPDGKQEYAFVFPRFVPGHQEVLFTSWGRRSRSGISHLGLPGRDRSTIVPRGTSGTVTTSGHLLFTRDDSPWSGLLATPYPSRSGAEESSTLLLSGVYLDIWNPDLWLSLSSSGTLAYVPGDVTERSLVLVDEMGHGAPVTDQRALYGKPALSPDGRRIAADVEHKIWLYELGGSGRVRLAPENRDYDEAGPVWAPDGSRVIYGSNQSGNWEIYARAVGIAKSEVILQKEFDQFPVAIAPDGTLAFQESNPKTGWDIWLLSPAGTPTPWLVTPATEVQSGFSPDGRWLAYSSDESGRFEIYVRPVHGEGGRIQVSTEGGQEAAWSPKGNRLFYRQGAVMMAVDIVGRDTLVMGRHRRLFEGGWDLRLAEQPLRRSYAVTPDGEHFLMIRHEPAAIPDRINIVQNWFEELKRIVPTGKK
jgi:serine/threonine-protein kinase